MGEWFRFYMKQGTGEMKDPDSLVTASVPVMVNCEPGSVLSQTLDRGAVDNAGVVHLGGRFYVYIPKLPSTRQFKARGFTSTQELISARRWLPGSSPDETTLVANALRIGAKAIKQRDFSTDLLEPTVKGVIKINFR